MHEVESFFVNNYPFVPCFRSLLVNGLAHCVALK